jgi:long-subunit acyl-CoA synthetase (AMP-forming)
MSALNAPTTPKIKKMLFNFGFNYKHQLMMNGYLSNKTIWDKIVFEKVQQRLGGRVRMILTGSAPIAPYILDWFRTVFGCTVVEGYGIILFINNNNNIFINIICYCYCCFCYCFCYC